MKKTNLVLYCILCSIQVLPSGNREYFNLSFSAIAVVIFISIFHFIILYSEITFTTFLFKNSFLSLQNSFVRNKNYLLANLNLWTFHIRESPFQYLNKRCLRGSKNPHKMSLKMYLVNRSAPFSVTFLVVISKETGCFQSE